MEITSVDAGNQFTSTYLQDDCKKHSVWLMLEAPEYQEIYGQVKLTQRMLCTIAQSLMVHAKVLEAYIYFTFMCTEDHTFLVLPIK